MVSGNQMPNQQCHKATDSTRNKECGSSYFKTNRSYGIFSSQGLKETWHDKKQLANMIRTFYLQPGFTFPNYFSIPRKKYEDSKWGKCFACFACSYVVGSRQRMLHSRSYRAGKSMGIWKMTWNYVSEYLKGTEASVRGLNSALRFLVRDAV